MTIGHPKPPARAPKPRRPIPRVSPRRKAKRKTLAEKKKLRPSRLCLVNRCHKPAQHIGRCRAHADAHLHGLVRQIVVPNEFTTCAAAAWHSHLFPCGGVIQVNHIFKRGRMATTFSLDNVLPGCGALNTWAKYNEDHWHRMVKDWMGAKFFDDLERRALSGEKPDYEETERVLLTARKIEED